MQKDEQIWWEVSDFPDDIPHNKKLWVANCKFVTKDIYDKMLEDAKTVEKNEVEKNGKRGRRKTKKRRYRKGRPNS